MRPYPLTFHPILKESVWGGRNLTRFGKVLPDSRPIGESWEVADVTPDPRVGQSVIANGPLSGMTLRQAVTDHSKMILGSAAPAGGRLGLGVSLFPLLIKYLDAQENLSVQVHPSEAYATAHPGTCTKHEAWVILRAEHGAAVYLGLKAGVTREQFITGVAKRDVVALLNTVPVEAGQCFHIPSGTVHALGAGITLAEVQTASDWTFRIYDWGREDTPAAREMHIEQALQCMDFSHRQPLGSAPASLRPPIEVRNVRTQPLAETPHFNIERIDALDDTEIDIVTSGIPEVWMVLSGRGQIFTGNQPILEIKCGVTTLVPAALSELEPASAAVQRGTSILRITLPSPVKGMIASCSEGC